MATRKFRNSRNRQTSEHSATRLLQNYRTGRFPVSEYHARREESARLLVMRGQGEFVYCATWSNGLTLWADPNSSHEVLVDPYTSEVRNHR